MPASDSLRLELELDSRTDPIEGHLGNPDGERIPFTGWLELMAAVQKLTGAPPVTTPLQREPGDGRE